MSLEAGAGAPLARYAAWRRAGDFIFLSGIIPVNPLNGTIVNGFQDVPEEVRELLGQRASFRRMRNRADPGPELVRAGKHPPDRGVRGWADERRHQAGAVLSQP
jgi:hypothetical protein